MERDPRCVLRREGIRAFDIYGRSIWSERRQEIEEYKRRAGDMLHSWTLMTSGRPIS